MMFGLMPKRFSSKTVKKLLACVACPLKVLKEVGSNVHVIDLSPDYELSSTLNISGLVVYGELAFRPSEYFEPPPTIESEPMPECPLAMPPIRHERIEQVLDEHVIFIKNHGFQRHLIR